MLEVKRKKGESFDSLLRRFGRRVQESGKILEARKIRYHSDEPNKNKVRSSAIRRLYQRQKREYLMRIGQLKEEVRKGGRR